MKQQIEQNLTDSETNQVIKRLVDILHIRYPEVFEEERKTTSEVD